MLKIKVKAAGKKPQKDDPIGTRKRTTICLDSFPVVKKQHVDQEKVAKSSTINIESASEVQSLDNAVIQDIPVSKVDTAKNTLAPKMKLIKTNFKEQSTDKRKEVVHKKVLVTSESFEKLQFVHSKYCHKMKMLGAAFQIKGTYDDAGNIENMFDDKFFNNLTQRMLEYKLRTNQQIDNLKRKTKESFFSRTQTELSLNETQINVENFEESVNQREKKDGKEISKFTHQLSLQEKLIRQLKLQIGNQRQILNDCVTMKKLQIAVKYLLDLPEFQLQSEIRQNPYINTIEIAGEKNSSDDVIDFQTNQQCTNVQNLEQGEIFDCEENLIISDHNNMSVNFTQCKVTKNEIVNVQKAQQCFETNLKHHQPSDLNSVYRRKPLLTIPLSIGGGKLDKNEPVKNLEKVCNTEKICKPFEGYFPKPPT